MHQKAFKNDPLCITDIKFGLKLRHDQYGVKAALKYFEEQKEIYPDNELLNKNKMLELMEKNE